MKSLDELLRDCATHHRRLCPRQVLGARMGILAASLLTLDLPQSDKRLLAFVETDGCFADGVSAATGCYVGRRTLRVEDFGKTAVTFYDTRTERAVRIAPRPDVRALAREYAPDARNRWEAQLLGYQLMPDEDLLDFKWVTMKINVTALIGRAGLRVNCDACGEEIINQREVLWESKILCRACAGQAYYLESENTATFKLCE
ncbi:MAG: hypothetical protein HFACDABA_01421 [Anaerolineales bacterium]|nr:hypothetical protein [Anaerolineales bacterium]